MIKKVYNQEQVLKIISENPGISSTQIAEKMQLNRVTIFLYLKELQKIEKIRVNGKGKATRYFPHESIYIASNIATNMRGWRPDQVHILKEEILFTLIETYGETESIQNFDATFEKYCMYIAIDDTILTGFDAFLGWCTDPKHNFSDRIVAKAIEYLDIIGSIEFRRKKYRFLDGTESARNNLNGLTNIAFDRFLFYMPSVLENGFGRTRTAIELYYGKLNNKHLLTHAIEQSIDNIREYARGEGVDCVIFTPPTNDRTIQFRDILESLLSLKLPKIRVEKMPPFGKILQPQKDIKDRAERVQNALGSLQVSIPNELNFYTHILILDDSFTTGATPNAIAMKLRNAGYEGKITIITICGSFNYDLAITEDEI